MLEDLQPAVIKRILSKVSTRTPQLDNLSHARLCGLAVACYFVNFSYKIFLTFLFKRDF